MTKEEVKQFIKDELKIKVKVESENNQLSVQVKLEICGEYIDYDFDSDSIL